MFGSFVKSALAAAGVLVAVAGAGSAAQAQEVRFGISVGTPLVETIDVRHRDRGPHHDRWDDRRDRGCDARQAVRKAQRMGVHRARVVEEGRRTLTVAGRDRGGRSFVKFANVRGCPVMASR